eukprot:6907302-Prymnesium_polylepis.1
MLARARHDCTKRLHTPLHASAVGCGAGRVCSRAHVVRELLQGSFIFCGVRRRRTKGTDVVLMEQDREPGRRGLDASPILGFALRDEDRLQLLAVHRGPIAA